MELYGILWDIIIAMDGSYIVGAGEVVQSLLRCFEERIYAYPSGRTSYGEWTAAVNVALRGLGETRGEIVYCSDGKPLFGEYLVNIMWWNPATFRPDAVFESEWKGIEEILYDFEKLLYLKCSLKVLICDPPLGQRDRLISELVNRIKRYPDHVAGERYIVINVKGNPFGGETECYEWNVPRNVEEAGLQFSMVAGSPFRYTFT